MSQMVSTVDVEEETTSEASLEAATEAATEAALELQYHQPSHVEQYGVEPIPAALKTVRWYDLFVIVVNFMINPATILTAGMAVAAGLSFWAAVVAQVLGCLVAFSAYVIMATVGVDYGIPGQVAARITFGILGSRWGTSLLRSIASVYWFAFQSIAGAIVITGAWNRWSGGHHSLLLVSIVFSLGQVLVAVFGYNWLKSLSRLAFPIKLVILTSLLLAMNRYSSPSFHMGHVLHYAGRVGRSGWSWPVLVVWLNGMAAAWLTMVTDAADFCRYSRSRADMWVGTISAAVIGTVFASFIGAYGAAATLGSNANIFTVVTAISTSGSMLLAIVVLIVLENWTINVLNLYTGGLSLANMFESVGRFWTTLAIGVAGVLLSTQPLVVQGYMQFTTDLGNLFAPVAGVLLADYVLVKRGQIELAALSRRNGPYWYWHGISPVAFGWVLIGLCVYLWTPVIYVQSLVTVVVTGTGFYLSTQLLRRYFVDAQP
jgi:NCS1 family nucleobase:cation symporter-1